MKLPLVFGGLFIVLIGIYLSAAALWPESIAVHDRIAVIALVMLILMVWRSYVLFTSFFTCNCHEIEE